MVKNLLVVSPFALSFTNLFRACRDVELLPQYFLKGTVI